VQDVQNVNCKHDIVGTKERLLPKCNKSSDLLSLIPSRHGRSSNRYNNPNRGSTNDSIVLYNGRKQRQQLQNHKEEDRIEKEKEKKENERDLLRPKL
jgi:hypothetical protein